MSRLRELAESALEQAKRAGADMADASVSEGSSLVAEIKESTVNSCERRRGQTLIVRSFVAGGCGIHICHGLGKGDVARAAEASVGAARAAGPDPDFKALPSPGPSAQVPDLHDESLASMTVKEAAEHARASISGALSVEPSANISGALSVVTSEGVFVNSLGLAAEERATSASIDLLCLIRRAGSTGSFAEFDVGRTRGVLALEEVGAKAARKALAYLGPRKMGTGRVPIVLGPLAAGSLIESIAQAATADAFQRGRSFLCDKLGTRIAPAILTIEDDGRFPGGMHSSSRDGEGTPRRRVAIVEEGVFVNLLHNSYTAGKAGSRSTGHGSQLGGIAPTNLRPAVGSRPESALVAEVREGLYLESCAFSVDYVSGELSAAADWGMKIGNGELAHPVTGLVLYGNILELLAGLEEISSDFREEPGAILPSMRFAGMDVSS